MSWRKSRNELASLLAVLRQTADSALVTVATVSIVMNVLVLALPLYSLQIFDRVLLSRSGATLFFLTLIVCVLLTAYAFLEGIRLKLLLRIGNRFQLDFERRVLDACIARSATVSEPVIQPLRNLAIVRNFLASPQGIIALVDTPLALIFLLVVFLIHPVLAGAMMCGIGLLVAVALASEWSTAIPVKSAAEVGRKAQSRAQEIVGNAELVEAMGMRAAVLRYWRRYSQESLHHQSVGGDRNAVLTAVGRWGRLIVSISLTGLGAYLAIEDRITIGGMVAAGILMGRGLSPLENLIPLWRQLIGARNAWHQLNEALEHYPRRETAMVLPPPAGSLSLEQVIYVPPGSEAPTIRAVTLKIPPGSQVGIVGPVSAGKSTLAKLICGVWKPRAGTVRLDDAEVYQWNREDYGRHVGYLPQGAELFSGTVRDNIARFGEARDEDVVTAAQLAGVHEIILRLTSGYETVVGVGGAALSGGMRQRIGLARALFGDPRLVVLDEPGANLDSEGQQALHRALAELRGRRATVIVMTHQLSLLKEVDLVGVMIEGQLTKFGPRGEILKQAEQQPVHLVRSV